MAATARSTHARVEAGVDRAGLIRVFFEGDDGDLALESALIGGGVRLLVRHFLHVADLVELGFGIALLGESFERGAYGRIIVGRDQHHVDALRFAALLAPDLARDDRDGP